MSKDNIGSIRIDDPHVFGDARSRGGSGGAGAVIPMDPLLGGCGGPGSRGLDPAGGAGGHISDSEIMAVVEVLKTSGLLHWNEHESTLIGLAADILHAVNNPKK